MPKIVVRAPKTFETGLARIRDELEVPREFPAAVLDEAQRAQANPGPEGRLDARHLPLIAIDPPGSKDLDQALALGRQGDGFRLHYAIADVGGFVVPGGAIDAEARQRGATLYSPDGRAPLHPPELSENRASLLPSGDKPALLWTIDLDGGANPTDWRLERALVRTRAAISYAEAQSRIDRGSAPTDAADTLSSLALLAEVGALRQEREAERGGISLNLPAQTIVEHDGSYALSFDRSLPVEGWNAQISLLTGIVAAQTMVEARIGILRTLPKPFPNAVNRLQHTARALGLSWPRDLSYASFVRRLDPNTPTGNAFLLQAARTLRGAGYSSFVGTVPATPEHGAIASIYAHVTAPLRRLVDRFGNEIVLALCAGNQPPNWAVEALDELPTLMGHAQQRQSALERALLDYAEAAVLATSVGQVFHGFVVDISQGQPDKAGPAVRAQVQIADPAIVTSVVAEDLSLAQAVTLRLTSADPDARSVAFELVRPEAVPPPEGRTSGH